MPLQGIVNSLIGQMATLQAISDRNAINQQKMEISQQRSEQQQARIQLAQQKASQAQQRIELSQQSLEQRKETQEQKNTIAQQQLEFKKEQEQRRIRFQQGRKVQMPEPHKPLPGEKQRKALEQAEKAIQEKQMTQELFNTRFKTNPFEKKVGEA